MTARRQHETYTRLPPGLLAASVGVLTSGYWPTYPVLEVRLPAEADALQALFQEFYLSKYSGRRLVWQHNLGTAVLKAWFPKGAKELAVSTTQVRVRVRGAVGTGRQAGMRGADGSGYVRAG